MGVGTVNKQDKKANWKTVLYGNGYVCIPDGSCTFRKIAWSDFPRKGAPATAL